MEARDGRFRKVVTDVGCQLLDSSFLGVQHLSWTCCPRLLSLCYSTSHPQTGKCVAAQSMSPARRGTEHHWSTLHSHAPYACLFPFPFPCLIPSLSLSPGYSLFTPSERVAAEARSPTQRGAEDNWSILHRTGPHVWTDSVLRWTHAQGIGYHEGLQPGGRLVGPNARIMPGETFGCAAHFFSNDTRLDEVGCEGGVLGSGAYGRGLVAEYGVHWLPRGPAAWGPLLGPTARIMPGETFGCAAHFFSNGTRPDEVGFGGISGQVVVVAVFWRLAVVF